MRLGHYELLHEIGRGGQGIVYHARDSRRDREVALKTLLVERTTDPDRVARLRREATAVMGIIHPGICSVHEQGEVDGRPYVVMDYLQGTTLAHRIREARGQFKGQRSDQTIASPDPARLPREPERRARFAVDLIEQIARAAHAAHEHGVVHRDLKPANVMLLEDGRAVLLDFGLAGGASGDGDGLTRVGGVLGTPAYMSPEQLQPRLGKPGRRSDVHALGALLYETLTLAPSFEAPTRAGIYCEVLTREVRLPERFPKDLAAVVETALAKEPARRYATAKDLADDLARIRRGERTRARRAGAMLRLRRWARHNRALAASISATLAGLVAALLLTGFQIRDARASRVELQRFIDGELLPQLIEQEATSLYPVLPGTIGTMNRWIEDAQALLARADGEAVHAGLVELRALIERVQARARDAESLGARTLDRHAEDWRDTLAALAASERYGGLAMEPQLGLVPLGRDLASGLFEFAHVQSGEVPERDPASGEFRVGEGAGIVFVLIPPGTFTMGAERPSWERPAGNSNVDPFASAWESPLHRVTLDAFFLSKYEMTQGQWLRLMGENPSGYSPDWPEGPANDVKITLAHPVGGVSWHMASQAMSRYGLAVPTEAQWEYAARAGTTSIWSTGWAHETLRGHVNLADRSLAIASNQAQARADGLDIHNLEWPELDDGFKLTAPVGSFASNAFGLHDVHGNQFELVRDAFGPYTLPTRRGNGERLGGNPDVRIHRGGTFASTPSQSRSAFRGDTGPDSSYLGLRPARAIWD